ncbi:MBL fold metallo-hydrolase [Aquimarina sp. ERC-38]|uniref:MBL fold metallo-hydrolase n=1 Tax=Aquimarina sp. ERC-38 TaxID=2949996 RepID=UPI002245A43D|nr:MBL fold metallo-hydrolase [Aquimarina sp. ERC-38]UZO80106.1 MBL fold metallo-hydrolase [Aquimarina sp. ERC-38]
MKNILFISVLITVFFTSCKNTKKSEDSIKNTNEELATNKIIPTETTEKEKVATITPIEHATTVVEYNDVVIYIDPTGGRKAFEGQKKPDMVLITDIHGDHMNIATLDSLDLSDAQVIAPQAVAEKLPASYNSQLIILNNGESKNLKGITIEAIPMYNLREEALKFHNKGRGNGYVLTLGKERVYFSGDTEDIPEMRSLENIDKAFVCMNLPYTMPVEAAADAVLAFKPKRVYPYHYRGTEGLSDVSKFKALVNAGSPDIEVIQWDWYPAIP